MDVLSALPFAGYGATFRLSRQIAERCYRPASLTQYRSLQEKKVHVLITRMLQHPQEWVAHIELSAL
jgi:hypothetical protein